MLSQNTISLANQVDQVCNMCMAMGIHKNVYQGETKTFSHMPVSLYPYEISDQTYNKLAKAHQIWVKLLLKVSKDKQFINQVFQKTANSDAFVKRFLDLYNKYIDKQVFGVSCLRVDYMGDEKPQLVEFNIMSVGLNGISDAVQKLASLKKKHRVKNAQVYYPVNTNQIQLLNAIQTVLNSQKKSGLALMVVHEKSQKQFNFGDQNAFQLQALRRSLNVKRVSMTQFIQGYLIDQENDLYLNQEKVCLVYFRTAYAPAHFLTEDHWTLRQSIQKANVLSIPSVSMQLINFKRMQVQLSKIEVLRKFISEEQAILIRSLSGEIYDFQNQSEIEKLLNLFQTGDYVLKPNRQGGGNNYFGKEVSKKIKEMIKTPGQLQKYIMMNKIISQIHDNVFIANYRYSQVKQSTAEVSTFGSFAYKSDEIIFSQCGGTLVRIKRAEQNEGGIAVDKAVIAGICVKITEESN